ncbi:hypothetical protein IG631_24194, partial [Alternaria alternata]
RLPYRLYTDLANSTYAAEYLGRLLGDRAYPSLSRTRPIVAYYCPYAVSTRDNSRQQRCIDYRDTAYNSAA